MLDFHNPIPNVIQLLNILSNILDLKFAIIRLLFEINKQLMKIKAHLLNLPKLISHPLYHFDDSLTYLLPIL